MFVHSLPIVSNSAQVKSFVQAFKLATGWTSKRICHLCNGSGWHNPTDSSEWCQDNELVSPFKPGLPSALLDVPGCNAPRYIVCDYMHAFHLGYGMDLGASTVVLLCFLGHHGPPGLRGLDDKLERAYSTFKYWCHQHGKTTSISTFSKLGFDMSSNLGR